MTVDHRASSPGDQDLDALLAELTAARARARELEQQLVEIVGSGTWRFATRLRARKRRLTGAGPLGSILGHLIWMGQVIANEGPGGLATRAQRRLRPPAPPPPQVPAPKLPPPAFSIPPLTSASGASIVIPVVHLGQPVYECLKSVVERTPGGHYEVIVVDNTASDHMRWVLAHFAGVRAIANDRGRAAVDSLNQGAQLAAGRFVLLLSPDTLVLDGWLPPLVEALARDPTAGAAGPKLIALDGSLHQAGRIVWSDGVATDHGRGGDPHRPEYLYRREVDAIAATCLLVRRQLFARVGGLDPALGEHADVDLAFALRELGQGVVYEPRSRVVRLDPPAGDPADGVGTRATAAAPVNGAGTESEPAAASAAAPSASRAVAAPPGRTDDTDAARERFAARRADALAEQYFRHPSREFRARSRRPGLRILIVDHMVPAPDRDAGSVRMLAMLELLGELGHHVTFIPDNLTPQEPYTSALQQMGVEVLFGDMSIPEYVAAHARDVDLVVVCRATIAGKYVATLAAQPAPPAIVFDTVDLHFLREQRLAALDGDAGAVARAAAIKADELALARASQAVWVVSPHEADVLRAEDPGLRVDVVPLIHATRAGTPGFAARRDLMFIGGFRHPPNEDAVRHFASEILPRLAGPLPEVRFLAVGPDPPPSVQALAGARVSIMGYVADVDPVFDGCRVFVAPLRYGAGLKGKIVQSLACGLPVVTTSVGAEGLGVVDGEHVLIADAPDAFAERIARLYTDEALWTRLSEVGRAHVEATFGHAAVKGRLDAAVRAAAGGHQGRCAICGYSGWFVAGAAATDNLREALDCPRCGAISRDRFMAAVLAACLRRPPVMGDWPVDRSIVIREPSGYRARAEALARKTNYQPFKFPEENLEMLTDADASIDHLITADVLEHVRRDELAFREAHRVLKPGGYFFLQVPYRHGERTETLVEVDGDRDIYLCPPQYHDEDTLVYRIYGHDLLPRLEALGFSVGYVDQALPEWAAPRMNMIVCRKGAALEDDPAGAIRFDRQWPR